MSQEGQALLFFPAATVLWNHLGYTLAAVKMGWPGLVLTLVSVNLPPLTNPQRSHLGEAGLLPTKAAFFIKLGTVLELLDSLA